jgi:hypothetical protein
MENRMRTKIGIAVVLAAVLSLAVTAGAGAVTPAQYGAKCNAAWTGKRGTHDYRVYKKSCVAAAVAAARAARSAGDNDDDAANSSRATQACGEQSPPPRKTKALRVAYRACVSAAVEAQKAYGGRPLAATLAGAPGDTTDQDGAGSATFTLNQGHGQICYDVSWSGLGVVGALHIHALADGAIVVPLDADAVLTDGNAKGCVDGIAKNLIKAIRQHPERYYVNVHSDEFPDGAIRGTLHK